MNQTTHHTTPTATAGIGFGSIKALSVSAGIPTPPVSLARGPEFSTCCLPSPRSAFTLVELLVVIGIIATLAALVTPAVMRAQATARNAAIKAEIDMLHMAIMNYKNEYGSFPPCCDQISTSANRVQRHLRKLFPRMDQTALAYGAEMLFLNTPQAPLLFQASASPAARVFCENALFFWLRGYTDSPTNPFNGPRKPLYDFDSSRVESGSTPCGQYHPKNLAASPYLYRDNAAYFQSPGVLAPLVECDIATSEDRNRNGILDAGEDINGNGRIDYVGEDINGNMVLDVGEDVNLDGRLNFGEPFNASTFQIICAGRDGEFGTDDDLSNFWPGTRRDYLDSLRR